MIFATNAEGFGLRPFAVHQVSLSVKNSEIMRGNSFFALLAGAAIGVAAGILLAPDKGSETRKKLKEMAAEGGEKAKEEADKLREEMAALKDMLSKEGSQLKEEGKAAILAQLRKLEKALSGYEDDIEEQVAEEA